jgi:hypothetical protein
VDPFHQGVPLAVRDQEYQHVIDAIKNDGSVVADVEGSLEVLPRELAPIRFSAATPRYVLSVNKFYRIHSSDPEDVMVTIGAMYSGADPGTHADLTYSDSLGKSWTFCSFKPNAGETSVREAVDWLRGYAIRFSGVPNPVIFSDFDEHYDHFPDPVEFSLSQLFSSDINLELLTRYGRRYGFTINVDSFYAGDYFSGISNSLIINRSNVGGTIDSFDPAPSRSVRRGPAGREPNRPGADTKIEGGMLQKGSES